MKVYVVTSSYTYEGDTVEAVFDSYDKAEDYLLTEGYEPNKDTHGLYDGTPKTYPDWAHITEWEVK